MRQGRRYGLSAEQKAELWRLWRAGESLHEIGRALDKSHSSIQFLLLQHGGIAPAMRHRSERALTLAEREDISRGIASGLSIRGDSQRPATGSIHGEPGGSAQRRPVTVSSQRSRSAGLENSSSTQAMSSCFTPEVAGDRGQ
jgi:hypothetical protein